MESPSDPYDSKSPEGDQKRIKREEEKIDDSKHYPDEEYTDNLPPLMRLLLGPEISSASECLILLIFILMTIGFVAEEVNPGTIRAAINVLTKVVTATTPITTVTRGEILNIIPGYALVSSPKRDKSLHEIGEISPQTYMERLNTINTLKLQRQELLYSLKKIWKQKH